MHNGAVLMEWGSGSTILWLECPIVLPLTQVKWTVISPSLHRPREDAPISGVSTRSSADIGQ